MAKHMIYALNLGRTEIDATGLHVRNPVSVNELCEVVDFHFDEMH